MAENPARATTANSGANSGQALMQQNAQARAAILAQSVNMVQSIAGGTITAPGNTSNVVNIVPRLVGFCKRFLLEITATITNNDNANDLTITEWGPANILQQVIFTDLSNNIRIQTAGWHLFALSSVKRSRPFGSAFLNDSPINFGSNWSVVQAPVTIPRSSSAVVNMIFEIPLSYSDTDFRGGVWLGVTNATANLQFTINPNPTVAAGADSTLAMYSGTANATISSFTYNVYQNYLDQLPVGKSGIVLPINDISTVYLINNVTQSSINVNQDYPVPYANFRDFLSTFAIYDNGGVLGVGGDINYWAIQAANYVNTIKIDPDIAALWTRNMLNTDLPKGAYYFSHRHKPISTISYGNQELVLNASTVNTGAKLYMAYESFALVNLIAQAGSLAIS
jgi:hypothetical protein